MNDFHRHRLIYKHVDLLSIPNIRRLVARGSASRISAPLVLLEKLALNFNDIDQNPGGSSMGEGGRLTRVIRPRGGHAKAENGTASSERLGL
jgi:hypothetical protein